MEIVSIKYAKVVLTITKTVKSSKSQMVALLSALSFVLYHMRLGQVIIMLKLAKLMAATDPTSTKELENLSQIQRYST